MKAKVLTETEIDLGRHMGMGDVMLEHTVQAPMKVTIEYTVNVRQVMVDQSIS